MRKAVLDSTVLVSAFLTGKGASMQLLREAQGERFLICSAPEILDEIARVLLNYPRIRKRYIYSDEAVAEYIQMLTVVARIVKSLPQLKVIERDPNDDMIVACAVKARTEHIITRDADLLEIKEYQDISIVTPEAYLTLLR